MERIHYRGSTLEYLTLYPDAYNAEKPHPLIVCLHGFGANIEDLTSLVSAIDPCGHLYVFPNGPVAAVNEADDSLRAWYERGGNESPEAVRFALQAFDSFVQEVLERYRVPASKVVLLGFSQGGAVALRYGLPRPDRFAGIAVLSGSLRQVEDLRPDLPAERKQPIFVGHGTWDSLVPVEYSHKLVAFLEGEGYRPFFRTYPMDHQVSLAELRDLGPWVRKVLPANLDQGQVGREG